MISQAKPSALRRVLWPCACPQGREDLSVMVQLIPGLTSPHHDGSEVHLHPASPQLLERLATQLSSVKLLQCYQLVFQSQCL